MSQFCVKSICGFSLIVIFLDSSFSMDFNLQDIPLPSPPTVTSNSTMAQTGDSTNSEEFNKYWAQAQSNLQRIAPPPPVSAYPSASEQFYQMPTMTDNFMPGFNPLMLSQGPTNFPQPNPSISAQARLLAEQRLRAVMPQGAPINAFRVQNPRGAPNNFRPRGSFQPRGTFHNRMQSIFKSFYIIFF